MAIIAVDTQEALAAAWNDKHAGKVDIPVMVQFRGKQVRTRTSGSALVINGRACITVRHITGAVPLSTVTLRHEVWVKVHRRGLVSHWLHTVWDSESQFLRAMRDTTASDPRITSWETSNVPPAS